MRVVVAGADEARVVVGDEKTDNGEGDDVKEADAPEDLLDGRGEGLTRVAGLCGGETDQFGAGKGEGCGHEDGAEAFETVVEGAWVGPVFTTDVGAVWAAANVEDNAENTE